MKVKEHNTWLSIVGILQLVAMACFGFFVNEIQKLERNNWLTFVSFSIALVVAVLALRTYLMIFKKVKNPKK